MDNTENNKEKYIEKIEENKELEPDIKEYLRIKELQDNDNSEEMLEEIFNEVKNKKDEEVEK